MPSPVDFAALYGGQPGYIARRPRGAFEQAQIDIEVRPFKLRQLLSPPPEPQTLSSALEIGCAAGERIAAVPLRRSGRKAGLDISATNVAVARERHPEVEFRCGAFRIGPAEAFDAVIVSDMLERVPDDAAFLYDAAALRHALAA